MKSKILLLDTSFSAKPIYDYLLTTDSEVFVLGGNTNDALAKSVNNYINIDYSNVDEVESFIKKEEINYLVPGGNDFSYKICSIINEQHNFYNIDSIEVNEIINNKNKFRKFALKNKLSIPPIISEKEIKINLPVIIKPSDAYSGHGITVIYNDDYEIIKKAIQSAKEFSKSGTYIIEKFMEGQLFSHSAFISEGKIIQDFIVEEQCIVNQYAVDTSRVVYNFDEILLEKIRNEIQTLCSSLKLPDGLVHTQFISNDKNFWLIEVTRRCPGDLYSRLIEESTGFPYAEFYAKPFLDITNKINDGELQNNNLIRHTITIDNAKSFNSFKLTKPIDNLEIVTLSVTGDKLKESPFGRIGVLFANLNDTKEANILFNEFINQHVYKVY